VAALCAEYCSAKMVIYGTDVDGVYSADPNKVSYTQGNIDVDRIHQPLSSPKFRMTTYEA
jgi:aspartokinase